MPDKPLPHVTDILAPYYTYYYRQVFPIFGEKNPSLKRGTIMHQAIQDWELHLSKPKDGIEKLAVDRWENIKKLYDLKTYEIELDCVSEKYGYCGKADIIGELPNKKRVLIDVKSSKKSCPISGLQLAAYWEMLENWKIEYLWEIMIGSEPFIKDWTKKRQECWMGFLGAMTAWKALGFKNQRHKNE